MLLDLEVERSFYGLVGSACIFFLEYRLCIRFDPSSVSVLPLLMRSYKGVGLYLFLENVLV